MRNETDTSSSGPYGFFAKKLHTLLMKKRLHHSPSTAVDHVALYLFAFEGEKT